MRHRHTLIGLSMLLGGPGLALAQSGTILGRVTDSTEAVIVGALLTVSGSGARSVTNGAGRYVLTGVTAGSRRSGISPPTHRSGGNP